jgi:hypothetical protein
VVSDTCAYSMHSCECIRSCTHSHSPIHSFMHAFTFTHLRDGRRHDDMVNSVFVNLDHRIRNRLPFCQRYGD